MKHYLYSSDGSVVWNSRLEMQPHLSDRSRSIADVAITILLTLHQKCQPSPLELNSTLSQGRDPDWKRWALAVNIFTYFQPRREWRMKWSADEDKKALVEAQKALEAVLPAIKALPGFKSVQRVVCGGCSDFKVSQPMKRFLQRTPDLLSRILFRFNRSSFLFPPNNSAHGEKPPLLQKPASWKSWNPFQDWQ